MPRCWQHARRYPGDRPACRSSHTPAFMLHLESLDLPRVGFDVPGERLNLRNALLLGNLPDAELDIAPRLGDGLRESDGWPLNLRAAPGEGVDGLLGQDGTLASGEDAALGFLDVAREPLGDDHRSLDFLDGSAGFNLRQRPRHRLPPRQPHRLLFLPLRTFQKVFCAHG